MSEQSRSRQSGGAVLTAVEAHSAILAGRTVRVVIGPDPDDPVCLNYLDRCAEFDGEPMIYTESVGGWSEGAKEAICDPGSAYYVERFTSAPPLSMVLTDREPPQREAPHPVAIEPATASVAYEVQIVRWTVYRVLGMPGLSRIDLDPEYAVLTFKTAPGCEPAGLDFIVSEVERMTGGAYIEAAREVRS